MNAAEIIEKSGMLTEEQAWAAVLARDAAADGELVYAVTTTGVFCRPTCPSRRPARRNVVFFADAPTAQAAGYRPCRRCLPHQRHVDAELVEQIASALERDRQVTLAELGRMTGKSPFTIERKFQQILGLTPAQYQRQRRAERMRLELMAGRDGKARRVTDAVYEAGVSGPGRAWENTEMGMKARAFQRGGAGERIGFATGECGLGRMLLAATERGVCAVMLGDADEAMDAELREQFPRAAVRAEPGLADVLEVVMSQLTEHPAALDLPLDLRATAFQMRVWEALRRIPRGETLSYAELARELGQPKAVRAVARACATNPVAVVVPCHRVVGSDGKMTGYRWGVERKRRLLEMERAIFPKGDSPAQQLTQPRPRRPV